MTGKIRRWDSHIHETKARHWLFLFLFPARVEGPRGTARVDEELVHILEGIKAVGATPAEDIDVEFVGVGEEQVRLVGDERETF